MSLGLNVGEPCPCEPISETTMYSSETPFLRYHRAFNFQRWCWRSNCLVADEAIGFVPLNMFEARNGVIAGWALLSVFWLGSVGMYSLSWPPNLIDCREKLQLHRIGGLACLAQNQRR